MKYQSFSSPFDTFSIIWKEIGSDLRIQRIFLSDPTTNSEMKTLNTFKTIKKDSSSEIEILGKNIQKFLSGDDQKFKLEHFDLEQCFESQRKVLLAEYQIPRGWVSTYNRIANKIGIMNGARVVGNALAKNPFPIVIPCHRVVKSNGELGEYQGGKEMKRALLKLEGLKFSDNGKIISDRYYY